MLGERRAGKDVHAGVSAGSDSPAPAPASPTPHQNVPAPAVAAPHPMPIIRVTPHMSTLSEEREEEEREQDEEALTEESSDIPETPSLSRASSLTDEHEHPAELPAPSAHPQIEVQVPVAGQAIVGGKEAVEVRV